MLLFGNKIMQEAFCTQIPLSSFLFIITYSLVKIYSWNCFIPWKTVKLWATMSHVFADIEKILWVQTLFSFQKFWKNRLFHIVSNFLLTTQFFSSICWISLHLAHKGFKSGTHFSRSLKSTKTALAIYTTTRPSSVYFTVCAKIRIGRKQQKHHKVI